MSVNMGGNMCTYLVESGLVWLASPSIGTVECRGNVKFVNAIHLSDKLHTWLTMSIGADGD